MPTAQNINFLKNSRAVNSATCSDICLKYDLIRDTVVVLLNAEIEEDPIKNEGAEEQFFKQSRAANSNLIEIQTHMRYSSCPHVTAKNDETPTTYM